MGAVQGEIVYRKAMKESTVEGSGYAVKTAYRLVAERMDADSRTVGRL